MSLFASGPCTFQVPIEVFSEILDGILERIILVIAFAATLSAILWFLAGQILVLLRSLSIASGLLLWTHKFTFGLLGCILVAVIRRRDRSRHGCRTVLLPSGAVVRLPHGTD